MFIHGFHHLALQVREPERMATFYREVLKLHEQVRHHRPDGSLRSIWLEVPGAGFLALETCEGEVREEPFRRQDPGWLLVAFKIMRAERKPWLDHFSALGVEVVHQTRFSFYVRDPEGNRLAFSHHPEDASEA